jgi:putative transposase
MSHLLKDHFLCGHASDRFEVEKMRKRKKWNAMKQVNWAIVRMLEKKALDIDPTAHFNPWNYCTALEKNMQQIRSTRNCKYMLNFHIVWCLRGRVKILFHEARILLRAVIESMCRDNRWIPFAIEPMPDHIHLFVSTKDFREDVLGKLKGNSSAFLQQCCPIFKKALTNGKLWSRSYYISSIGNISGKTLLNYLAKQWKEFGDPRYQLAQAALHKEQKKLSTFIPC